MWTADIRLKSGRNVIVEDLVSINQKRINSSQKYDSSNFDSFVLFEKHSITFVGSKSACALNTEEIEYVSLTS